MATKLSGLLRQAGHPGYAIDAEALEHLVTDLASSEPIHSANLALCQSVNDALRARVADLEGQGYTGHFGDLIDIKNKRIAELEKLHPGEWELKGSIDAVREVDRLRAHVAELDCRIIDLENTVNAIADPWDYETGLEKTAESCRAIATDCVARLNL